MIRIANNIITYKRSSDYRSLKDKDYSQFIIELLNGIKNRFDIDVIFISALNNRAHIGSYNHKQIIVKDSLKSEYKLFLIAHLFGHICQWKSESIFEKDIPTDLPFKNCNDDSQLINLREYELEAAGYALTLLNEFIEFDLTQWFCDWSYADWNYFIQIPDLNTNTKKPEIKLKFGMKKLEMIDIPELQNIKMKTRYAY